MNREDKVFMLYVAYVGYGLKPAYRSCYEQVLKLEREFRKNEDFFKKIPRGFGYTDFIITLRDALDKFIVDNCQMTSEDEGTVKEPCRKMLNFFGYSNFYIDVYIKTNKLDYLKNSFLLKLYDDDSLFEVYKYARDNKLIDF